MITISLYILFRKAGLPGWNALIPFFNAYRIYEITYGNGWLIFISLIPLFGWAFAIVSMYRFYKAYDAPSPVRIVGVLLPIICMPILAFGHFEYAGYDEADFKRPLVLTLVLILALIAGIIVTAKIKPGLFKGLEKDKKTTTKQPANKENNIPRMTYKRWSFATDKDLENIVVELTGNGIERLTLTKPGSDALAGDPTERSITIQDATKGEYVVEIAGRDVSKAHVIFKPGEEKKEKPKVKKKKPAVKKQPQSQAQPRQRATNPTSRPPQTAPAKKKSSGGGDSDVSSTL